MMKIELYRDYSQKPIHSMNMEGVPALQIGALVNLEGGAINGRILDLEYEFRPVYLSWGGTTYSLVVKVLLDAL